MQRALSHLYDLGIDFTLVYNVIQGKGKIISERGLGTRDTGFYYFRYGDGAVKLTKPKGVPWNLGCKWLCSIGFVFTKVYGCGDAQSCEVQNALFWVPGPGKDARFLERAPWLQKALRLFPWGEKAERDLSEANDARKVEAAAAGAKAAKAGVDAAGELPEMTATRAQLESKFKHAVDFGVTESRGAAGFEAFGEAVQAFVKNPSTDRVTVND